MDNSCMEQILLLPCMCLKHTEGRGLLQGLSTLHCNNNQFCLWNL
jgi:hypothetical protein